MLTRAMLKIEGRVQGVFYRHSTKTEARALGLSGWVRNMDDGSVEAEVEGPRDVVEKLIDWCRIGPPNARVDNVIVTWLDAGDELLPEVFEVR